MQSEPTAVFGHTPLVDPSHEDSYNYTQHGHDSCGDLSDSHLRVEDRGSDPGSGSSEDGDSSSLNAGVSSFASVDRVSQYEQAMAQSPRRQRDLEFRVMPSSAPSRLSLEAFPNGRSSYAETHEKTMSDIMDYQRY